MTFSTDSQSRSAGVSGSMGGMHHDTLWAPWRLAYIQGHDRGTTPEQVEPEAWRAGADRACFLCRAAAAASPHDRALGVLERTGQSVVVINRFPYSNGHLLVAPLDHRPTLAALPAPQLLDLQDCLVRWCGRMENTLQAQGFNIGLNLGSVAGAGLPELVTTSPADYEALCLALAQDPARLAAIRTKLAATRDQCPLFDTRTYTRRFEAGLRQAFERARSGLVPIDIRVDR